MQMSIFSLEEPHARRSRSPDFAKDLLTRVETSASPSLESLINIGPSGFSGRMSPAYCQVAEDGTLVPSSGDWGNSGMGGLTGFSMRNMSEWTVLPEQFPKDEGVCSLSDVLETGEVPQRYFLSAKACKGILRRAEKRGKTLPPQLAHALKAVADSGPTSTVTAA